MSPTGTAPPTVLPEALLLVFRPRPDLCLLTASPAPGLVACPSLPPRVTRASSEWHSIVHTVRSLSGELLSYVCLVKALVRLLGNVLQK